MGLFKKLKRKIDNNAPIAIEIESAQLTMQTKLNQFGEIEGADEATKKLFRDAGIKYNKQEIESIQNNFQQFYKKKQFATPLHNNQQKGYESDEDDDDLEILPHHQKPQNFPPKLPTVQRPPLPPRKSKKKDSPADETRPSLPNKASNLTQQISQASIGSQKSPLSQGSTNSPKPTNAPPALPGKPRTRRKKSPGQLEALAMKNLREICITDEKISNLFTNMVYLNEGASGKVYKARHVMSGDEVALKVMELSKQPKLVLLSQEIQIMKILHHPNIVNMLECYLENDRTLTIVMELLTGGALTAVCDIVQLTQEHIAYICQQCLQGLRAMHDQNIIHRDIKSDNILLNKNGQIKLADFGFCAMLSSDDEKRRTKVGTPYWMAPEVIMGKDHNNRVDVWSMGITVIEMLDGDPPLMNLEPVMVMYRISTGYVPNVDDRDISPIMKDFLSKMLQPDPNKRPSCAQLLNHKFISLGSTIKTEEMVQILETVESNKC